MIANDSMVTCNLTLCYEPVHLIVSMKMEGKFGECYEFYAVVA